ncbi:MAG TPA: hypothetical protein VFS21_02195 [Roseiflexaceae bacterium]|nr:hypothetical protein [Roseiflexaceae bacterium]
MKVYRIRTDVNNYQYFLADREEEELKLFTNCEPQLHDWSPPKVYIYKPKHKAGEFYSFHSNSLIRSPRATQILGNFLEKEQLCDLTIQ